MSQVLSDKSRGEMKKSWHWYRRIQEQEQMVRDTVRAEWLERASKGRDKQKGTRQNVSKRQVVLNL